jgi:hypothetical protein
VIIHQINILQPNEWIVESRDDLGPVALTDSFLYDVLYVAWYGSFPVFRADSGLENLMYDVTKFDLNLVDSETCLITRHCSPGIVEVPLACDSQYFCPNQLSPLSKKLIVIIVPNR